MSKYEFLLKELGISPNLNYIGDYLRWNSLTKQELEQVSELIDGKIKSSEVKSNLINFFLSKVTSESLTLHEAIEEMKAELSFLNKIYTKDVIEFSDIVNYVEQFGDFEVDYEYYYTIESDDPYGRDKHYQCKHHTLTFENSLYIITSLNDLDYKDCEKIKVCVYDEDVFGDDFDEPKYSFYTSDFYEIIKQSISEEIRKKIPSLEADLQIDEEILNDFNNCIQELQNLKKEL